MSWMRAPAGGQRPHPAAQPYGNQQNMYPGYHQASNVPGQQQQYWQQQPPHPEFNQQYGQVYQQDYPVNANQFYQQPAQYNQNYQYANQQQGYQQTYYQNQQVQQQQNCPQKPKTDGWEDNWDNWSWEDSSKQGQKPPSTGLQPNVPQQQVFNNANVIEESFATTDTWNWSMDDNKEAKDLVQSGQSNMGISPRQSTEASSSNQTVETSGVEGTISQSNVPQQIEEPNSLNNRDPVNERIPNLALGKRFHLDNLTPQWSIESQMSQDSSEGPHTQSEGTYRSENQSRNSSKDSPGLNTDNTNFNYSHPGIDEFSQNNDWPKSQDQTFTDTFQNISRHESHDELSKSMQEMVLANNGNVTENISQDPNQEPDSGPIMPPPAFSPPSLPTHMSSNQPPPHQLSDMPPPPPVTSENLAPLTTATTFPSASSGPPSGPPTSLPRPPSAASLPRPPSAVSLPPGPASLPPPPISSISPHPQPSAAGPLTTSSSNMPPSFQGVSSTNPFKNSGTFSHKATSKSTSAMHQFPSQMPITNLSSPAVVGKVPQSRVPLGFEVNLETTPDNSERPDQPHVPFRPVQMSQQVPDNLEVAPQNDRNEYLQTAHLSNVDYGENTDFSRSMPPPGLRRMVVGQQESEYRQNLNLSGDEPPPGLSRMVPGQQTESENAYDDQPNNDFMERHIDGQPTDSCGRPYRQADGQQTTDNYSQQPPARGSDRRPIGMDRMVPGESSNEEYLQYQASNFTSNEHRVVTGVDHNFALPIDAGPLDVREQNVDGSDYSEQASRGVSRNVIGAREGTNDGSVEFINTPEDRQREVIMEGENLQDLGNLNVNAANEVSYSREQNLDGADITAIEITSDRKTDLSDGVEHPASSSRRQSLNRINTSGDDSERDRLFKVSPRRDRDKQKSSRDRDRDKEGRYSRGERKYDRDDRRSTRDDRRSEKDRRDRDRDRGRRDRDESPEDRRHRRSTRSRRYETEDTDYYSDRERERRRYREGSYTSSKPPRPEDKERRYDERDRNRRYNTIERDRRHDDEWGGSGRRRDRYERRYRDIDPTRKYGNLRREHDEERRRGEQWSPSRAESREATATDEDVNESRRRTRRHHDPYYDVYGESGAYADPYSLQRQQYSYYEQLRRTDPAAYMLVYKQLMGGHAPPYHAGYAATYSPREERASVHSGRSSATPLKGNDTDLNTEASLNLQLEESTVRSERMTPFRFSTAHIKGSISSRNVVVVRPSYPVDGLPATVQLLSLADALRDQPDARDLADYPGPLLAGVTHKKTVIEYCCARAGAAALEGRTDPLGYTLLWELLALLLRQNGVVVGSDIAELLMKSTREHRYDDLQGEEVARVPGEDTLRVPAEEDSAALDTLREYLIYGNRKDALEWAMSRGLWSHALQLGAHAGARTRAAVHARWLSAMPRTDPLHSLYAALACTTPPAATGVSEEQWGDWRPHAAILLANTSSRPDHDVRNITQLGDSLSSRGLVYSAQFCYVCAGVQFTRHPLAPLGDSPAPGAALPRLSLLLSDPRASSLQQFATNHSIFATEIYEYALSLNQNYIIPDLQVYKFLMAVRLVDCGLYERALAYAEAAARALTLNPELYSPLLINNLAELADRLQYHDPALAAPVLEEGDSGEPSPRHQQWLHDVKHLASLAQAESVSSGHPTPQHLPAEPSQSLQPAQQQYHWEQQPQQYQPPAPPYTEPAEEAPEYGAQYYQPPQSTHEGEAPHYTSYGDDWQRTDEQHANTYADPYWNNDSPYGQMPSEESRPTITMPGAHQYHHDEDSQTTAQQTDRDTDTPVTAGKKEDTKPKEEGGKAGGKGGWLGGILTKLSLRPPNQMILPDDKNPTIVWDEDKKRWRNLDGDSAEGDHPPPPPPKVADLAALAPSSSPPLSGAPPAAPLSNIFKMQKGRHIKKSYVDVFNPGGAARAPPTAPDLLGPTPPTTLPTNYFIPQSGIYDPSQVSGNGDEQYPSGM